MAFSRADGERVLSPLRDLCAFVLGEFGEHVNHQWVGMWVVGRQKVRGAFHQAGDEVQVSREPIQLRYHEGGVLALCFGECGGKLGTFAMAFAGLHFGELGEDLSFTGDTVNRLALGFET